MDETTGSGAQATFREELLPDGPRTYDVPDGRSPSRAVVASVADALDAEPLALPPLYDAIDPDALDAFLDSVERDDPRLGFAYAGVSVEFDGADRFRVTEI